MITGALVRKIQEQFLLNWHGIHGIRHWSRVYANGLRLAEKSEADVAVIELFALFHDSCRRSEGSDPDHGARGAELALDLHGRYFQLNNQELDLLVEACRYHTHRQHHDNLTVGICFDADRLDLGRVGKRPDPGFLSTPAAREKDVIQWATERSSTDYLPGTILADFLHE